LCEMEVWFHVLLTSALRRGYIDTPTSLSSCYNSPFSLILYFPLHCPSRSGRNHTGGIR
jgi:hypothetical protein